MRTTHLGVLALVSLILVSGCSAGGPPDAADTEWSPSPLTETGTGPVNGAHTGDDDTGGDAEVSTRRLRVEWSRTYGGPGEEEVWTLLEAVDGGYVLAGWSSSFGAGAFDVWLVKVDERGRVEWNKTYGGAGHDIPAYHAVVRSGDGYALAWTAAEGDEQVIRFIRTDSSGDVEWERTYDGAETVNAVVQTTDGGYALAGTVPDDTGLSDGWLLKVDTRGAKEWERTYRRSVEDDDVVNALIQTADGGYLLAGDSNLNRGTENSDFWVVKTDPEGAEEWNRVYEIAGHDEVHAAVQIPDGGYVLMGDVSPEGKRGDIGLVKIGASGTTEWREAYGGPGDEIAGLSLVRTPDGGFALSGEGGVSDVHGWIVKTDARGNEEWIWKSGDGPDGTIRVLVRTGDAGYVAGGFTGFEDSGSEFWLVKLSGNP